MKYWKVCREGKPWLDRMGECVGFFERLRGYMGQQVPCEQALWFPDQPSLHTFFMRFAIDIVFLDGQHRVVEVRTNVGPRRWVQGHQAIGAIEMPAQSCPRPVVGEMLEFQQCA